jgi:hypothetical protein
MEWAVLVGVVGFGLAIGGAVARWRTHKLKGWTQLAQDRGLTLVRGTWRHPDRVEGVVDGRFVQLDTHAPNDGRHAGESCTRIRCSTGVPEGVTIRRKGRFGAFLQRFARRRVEIGDREFDEELAVQGEERVVRALLGHARRRRVREALREPHSSVLRGEVVWLTNRVLTDAEALSAAIDAVVAIAEAVDPGDAPEAARLLDVLRDDPIPEVRAQAFAMLTPLDGDWAARAMELALADPDVRVSLPAQRDKLRRQLSVTWGELADLAASSHPDDRVLAAELASKHGLVAARRDLEAMLLDDDAVQIAALRALGVVGDRESVGMIKPHTSVLIADAPVRRAATAAVAAIQQRVGGTSGALALAESPADGALSFAEGGQLSVVARSRQSS